VDVAADDPVHPPAGRLARDGLLEVADEDHRPRKVLHLTSESDNSTISKEVRVDVEAFPILTWRWKMARLPRGGDARHKATDDQAGSST
jgi:hypothetical protein